MVDQNDNRTTVTATPGGTRRFPADSGYTNLPSIQQSLGKSHTTEDHQPQQLLPATYSMQDQLLASEL
jgi:hypothetical protein